MKGIDIFCASQAATAIRSTMEEITAVASSSSSAIQLGGSGGGRAIDRFNPIITDSRRRTAPVPKPPAQSPGGFGKTKKDKISKSSKSNNKKKNSRKAAAGEESGGGGGGGWRCTKPGGFITPQSSSRYLLNENEDDKDYFLDVLSDFNPILKLDDPNNDIKNLQQLSDQSGPSHTPLPLPPPPSSSSPPPPSRSTDQVVVVLRVSLHCRGCERKMRKHLSRMQGVSSFNIDFAAKKVTVVGDVTPLGVLASISKVKNAQLWSPAVAVSSIPPAVSLSNSSSKTAKPAVASVPTTNENMENISRNIQLISMN
ncbi:protein SODIUM POTASSIUM ROOT DEFECTIVE 2-like [Ipomoea triloba]|uniref:protein SODIUM POTASSIUM ROOT DEFECTIVE 2-like n=1 Tax=Ipomoea triloba TaxID=35885 RepID=UPI00125E8149|nr:protein SODIUM POTASSIUM ROOT DEFECTIVE 2-like [Ipomoea triloba]